MVRWALVRFSLVRNNGLHSFFHDWSIRHATASLSFESESFRLTEPGTVPSPNRVKSNYRPGPSTRAVCPVFFGPLEHHVLTLGHRTEETRCWSLRGHGPRAELLQTNDRVTGRSGSAKPIPARCSRPKWSSGFRDRSNSPTVQHELPLSG